MAVPLSGCAGNANGDESFNAKGGQAVTYQKITAEKAKQMYECI
jgi:hypothetical protein